MPVITIPRMMGGTLFINTPLPTATVPVVMAGRDGKQAMTGRDGKQIVAGRDGSTIMKGR